MTSLLLRSCCARAVLCCAAQRDKRKSLSWRCEEELFRQEIENADDVRLSVRLFADCVRDKRKFCADVEPGAGLCGGPSAAPSQGVSETWACARMRPHLRRCGCWGVFGPQARPR